MTLAIRLTTTRADCVCSILLKVAIHRISNMTIRSCTMSIPMLNLPEVDSISSLSPSSFKTTIVLLKANPIAKNHEVIVSNPINVAMKYHKTPVTKTWKNHAINDVFPRSLMMVGLSSIPTINNSNAIHKFPNDWKAVFAWSKDGKKILIAVPAIIYQIIIGCFNAFIRPILNSTIPITILSDINTCSAILYNCRDKYFVINR